MKSIKPVILTLFTALAVSGTSITLADTATTISSDGFLELTVEEAPAAKIAVKKTVQKAKPQSARANRAERKKRAQQRKLRQQRAAKKRAAEKRARARFYRVRSGDTLTKIAAKKGVSVNKLVRLNRLYGSKKNHIEVGMRLRLR